MENPFVLGLGGALFGILAPCLEVKSMHERWNFRFFISQGEPEHVLHADSSASFEQIDRPLFWEENIDLVQSPFTIRDREGVLLELGDDLTVIALFGPKYRQGWIHSIPAVAADLLLYRLGNRWFSRFVAGALAFRQGSFLHGLGVSVQGAGYLFLGESGAGKSTLARLFSQMPDVEIFGDDVVIVRKVDGRFLLYGTPWVSSESYINTGSVPLEGICFLHHAKHNWLREKTHPPLVDELASTPLDLWYTERTRLAASQMLGQLALDLPSYDFGFLPDLSAVDFICNRFGI